MKIQELYNHIHTPLVTDIQIKRVFKEESANQVGVQLSRWEKRGELLRLKRGLYHFSHREVDDMAIAAWMYAPSYISLETALHVYGLIPDVVQQVTSVSPVTTKKYVTPRGAFTYSKVKKELFFGFEVAQDQTSGLSYNIALPAKALLDYVYIRRITTLEESRIDSSFFQKKSQKTMVQTYAKQYPQWVARVVESMYE